MSKRARSSMLNLNELPDPEPEGRKHISLLRKEQWERKFEEFANPEVEGIVFNPCRYAVKWTKKEIQNFVAALQLAPVTLATLQVGLEANVVFDETVSEVVCSRFSQLCRLNLMGCPISAPSIRSLGSFQNLEQLELGGIGVSLRSPLPMASFERVAWPRLLSLTLNGTLVEDETLQCMVQGSPQLEVLLLDGSTSLTSHGVMALSAACTRLTELSLRQCVAVGADGVKSLSALTALRNLNLQRVPGTLESLPTLVRGCTSLAELSLCCCPVTRFDLAAVATLSRLVHLDLNGVKPAKPTDLLCLAELRTLEELSLNGMRGMDVVVPVLAAGCASLNQLDLNNSDVSGDIVANARKARPTCDISTINCSNM